MDTEKDPPGLRAARLSVDPERSRRMALIRSKDTKPEMLVRRVAHGMGYRFRLHRKDLPGRPDMVFPSRRAVVLVHGCFWHGHDCPKGQRHPKTNVDYWESKITGNMARDRASLDALAAGGWRAMVVWECETSPKCRTGLETRLRDFLG
ncbi:MAG: DNA mismatch endonuclease Vsr [Mesorhizobium sp.]|nr:MAG: DNA mismatch endonuclease Vsr [Mesorhizobium sp.]